MFFLQASCFFSFFFFSFFGGFFQDTAPKEPSFSVKRVDDGTGFVQKRAKKSTVGGQVKLFTIGMHFQTIGNLYGKSEHFEKLVKLVGGFETTFFEKNNSNHWDD